MMDIETSRGLKRPLEDLEHSMDADLTLNQEKKLDDYHAHEDEYTCLPVYGQHKRAVSCVSFAPTIASSSSLGQVICASGSADGSVKVWDISKALKQMDDNYRITVTEMDLDMGTNQKDSSSSLSTSFLSSSPQSIHPVATVMGHLRGINDLAWSPRAMDVIVTASDDKSCKLWDVTRSSTADSSVLAGTPSTSGATSSYESNPSNSTTNIHHPLVEFKGHSNFCFSVKFNPQGNLIVTGSFDETVKLWDVRTGECISTLPAHSDPVTGVDFNRDGTCIVSSSHDGLMRVWDVASGECLKTIYAEKNPPVTFVKYAPNGKYVLSGMLDGKLRLWDVMGRFDNNSLHMGLHGLIPTTNSNTTTIDRTLAQMVAGRGGQCTKTYSGHVNSKYCIFSAFSVANPNRQRIISGSEDGKVYIYDLQTRKIKQRLDAHSDACLAVAAHDTREILASGGMCNDNTVKFWVPNKGVRMID